MITDHGSKKFFSILKIKDPVNPETKLRASNVILHANPQITKSRQTLAEIMTV